MNQINLIDIIVNSEKVGRMALTPDGLCGFEYDSDYIKHGVSISLKYGL